MPLHIPIDNMLKALKDGNLYTGIKDGRAVTGIPSKECSDGHHTFNELYQHRYILWVCICRLVHTYRPGLPVWRSKLHSDGSMFEDSFVLGIGKKKGSQMVYHLHLHDWVICDFAETLDKAPEWDGHDSNELLNRLERIIL